MRAICLTTLISHTQRHSTRDHTPLVTHLFSKGFGLNSILSVLTSQQFYEHNSKKKHRQHEYSRQIAWAMSVNLNILVMMIKMCFKLGFQDDCFHNQIALSTSNSTV